MALSEIRREVIATLRTVPGIAGAPETVPPQIGEERLLIVYPIPGTTAPAAHSGRANAGPVIECTDAIVAELHLKISQSEIGEAIEILTPLVDLMRDAIWSEFARSRFGGTATRLASVDVESFGELGWGADFTFGARFVLEVVHHFQANARPLTTAPVPADPDPEPEPDPEVP